MLMQTNPEGRLKRHHNNAGALTHVLLKQIGAAVVPVQRI